MRWDMTDPVDIAGAVASATQTSLGDAFDDLMSGTVTRVPATEVTAQAHPTSQDVSPPLDDVAEKPPVEAATVPRASVDTSQAPDTAERVAWTEPVIKAVIAPAPIAPAPRPELVSTPNASDPMVAATPDQITAPEFAPVTSQRVETFAALTRSQPLTPDAPLPDPAPSGPQPSETVTAEEPDSDTLRQSLRPKVRPRGLKTEKARVKPRPEPPSTAAAPAGNAQVSATSGQRNAERNTERNRATSGAAQNTEPGNAAASNYPGQVAREIQRVRRPLMSARGVTQVSFRVADNGGLSALGVSQTSGSNRLDDAALTIIRRAVPFPAPPPGAQRSFRIKI